MKKFSMVIFAAFFILFLAYGTLWASSFISDTSSVSGGVLCDFEGYERGTPISAQYDGVTFGQTPYLGSPQIDKYGLLPWSTTTNPQNGWLYAYGASSGSGVLTGSAGGGNNEYPSVAGITVTFAKPVYEFQAFFSDTDPLGEVSLDRYTIKAFGSNPAVAMEEIIITKEFLLNYSEVMYPAPKASPLPGIYIGFKRLEADITSIQIGPGSYREDGYLADAFAIDDVQFKSVAVPEPATMMLLGLGLIGLVGIRRKIS